MARDHAAAVCLILTTLVALPTKNVLFAQEPTTEEVKLKEPTIIYEDYGRIRRFYDEMEGKPPRKLFCSRWIPPRKFDLEAHRGRVVMIFFWGSWCQACKRIMPTVLAWKKKYEKQGLTIVAIHSTKSGDVIDEALKDSPLPFKIGVDFKRSNEKRFHVKSYPDFYLVDRNGILRYANLSSRKESDITEPLEFLLNESASPAALENPSAPKEKSLPEEKKGSSAESMGHFKPDRGSESQSHGLMSAL